MAEDTPRVIAEWRPIETAPKDGTDILLAGNVAGTARQKVGFWSDNRRVWMTGMIANGEHTYFPAPTHWMLLPEPPAA